MKTKKTWVTPEIIFIDSDPLIQGGANTNVHEKTGVTGKVVISNYNTQVRFHTGTYGQQTSRKTVLSFNQAAVS